MSITTMHLAARLYYLEDLSQAEIAARLGVSRSTVSRLLRRARDLGIVRIEIRDLDETQALAGELAEGLGLRSAIAIAPATPAAMSASLARPTAELLGSLELRQGSVLALSWGQTLWELVRHELPPLPGVDIVPMVGAMDEPEPWFQTNEIVRVAAVQTGGVARFLHAPVMPSPALRRSLFGDPRTQATLALWDRIDVALLGIGAPPASLHDHGAEHVPRSDPSLARAVGDVSSRYFDIEGDAVPFPGEERLLGVSRKQLRAAGTTIAVASGLAKAPSIVGAARAGLIDVLVTDSNTAEAALSVAGGGAPERVPSTVEA